MYYYILTVIIRVIQTLSFSTSTLTDSPGEGEWRGRGRDVASGKLARATGSQRGLLRGCTEWDCDIVIIWCRTGHVEGGNESVEYEDGHEEDGEDADSLLKYPSLEMERRACVQISDDALREEWAPVVSDYCRW